MKSQSKPKVLLISNVDSTFVRHDEQLLAEGAIVKKFIAGQEKNFFDFATAQFRLLLFIINNIRGASVAFCWFADYHSFLLALMCKLLSKPFYLIQGGYDTTFIREINYGVHTSKWRSAMVDYAIENAILNLPVSYFLAGELQARYGESLPVEVLHTGYSVGDNRETIKEDIVLTVASVDSQKRLMIKGVDRFIEIANKLHETQFVLVGVKRHFLNGISLPENLKVIDYLATPDLDKLYQKSRVYTQFSIREGLPNAVLEAMAFECVVVALDHSGITEAVGQTGYLINNWDVDEVAKKISLALTDSEKGRAAKKRVLEKFNVELRRKRLYELVHQPTNN